MKKLIILSVSCLLAACSSNSTSNDVVPGDNASVAINPCAGKIGPDRKQCKLENDLVAGPGSSRTKQ
jgi:hypothetical protein